MERRVRRAEWMAIAALLAVMLVILFWPTPVDRPVDGGLSSDLSGWHRLGLPAWVDYTFVETTANVVLFMPLGGLISSLVMRPLWWASGVLGLTMSLCVEFGQAEFLPQRFASASDLAANTAGALLGGGLVALWRITHTRTR